MINELNIIADPEQSVEGYQNVLANQVPQITNGYVKNIICNCLDQLPFDVRNSVFLQALNKLCINGTLTIRYLNVSLLPNKIIIGDLTGKKLSEILPNLNSCWSDNEFAELMQQAQGCVISKLFYEHIHTVASIQKVK